MSLDPNTGIIQTRYSKSSSIICNKGKGQRRAFELILSLALLGPSTTSEVEKFILKFNYYQNNPVRKNTLRDEYNRIIQDRFYTKTGKKKTGIFPGLLKNQYVLQTGDKIVVKSKTKLYFLTLKGCFFALGFQFNDDQMRKFLRNASRNHLFFAYLNRIAVDTSIAYVRKRFITPINNFIEKDLLNVDEPVTFTALFEIIQMELMKKIGSLSESASEKEFEKWWSKLKYFERNVLKHTFYVEKATSDWSNFVTEYFYPTEEDQEFFLEFRDGEITEAKFLYRVMRSVHFGYFSGLAMDAPVQTQKIPYSRKWKAFKKMNPEYKSPQDFDKKKHQVIDYLVGYRVS